MQNCIDIFWCYGFLPLSASSSFWSLPRSPWISLSRAISSDVCVINGFVGGIFGGNGAGSSGIEPSSASRSVETTAWWNSSKSSPVMNRCGVHIIPYLYHCKCTIHREKYLPMRRVTYDAGTRPRRPSRSSASKYPPCGSPLPHTNK